MNCIVSASDCTAATTARPRRNRAGSPSAAMALAGVEVEPGRAQPADGQILEMVADLEDPQRLTAEIRALILGRAREFELQGGSQSMALPGCAGSFGVAWNPRW
ncbi:hypothetical protein [Paracoccus mutanolyticus]|uniref:hypothetical protein n=1 Tax=Paracoccus mutanolyticus TaxID=1499308 RepID=UPI001CB9338F|nr:hypothetical protein [Paracoccus mutanolyticus]